MTDQGALFPAQAEAEPTGPLTTDELRDRLRDLQHKTLKQMQQHGPDPTRLAMMVGIGAALTAMEEIAR